MKLAVYLERLFAPYKFCSNGEYHNFSSGISYCTGKSSHSVSKCECGVSLDTFICPSLYSKAWLDKNGEVLYAIER